MVRDYVEFHFDGPIVRALSDPRGRFGEWDWRFPDGNSLSVMRLYIGKTVTDVQLQEGEWLALEFDAERILIPLDEESRVGPEAAHVVGIDESGRTDASQLWIW